MANPDITPVSIVPTINSFVVAYVPPYDIINIMSATNIMGGVTYVWKGWDAANNRNCYGTSSAPITVPSAWSPTPGGEVTNLCVVTQYS